MFVRIENDILESACSGIRPNASLITLHEVAIALQRGKHYVFIPGFKRYEARLRDHLSSVVIEIFGGIKSQDANALDGLVTWKLIVTDNVPAERAQDNFYYSPSNDAKFELHEESHLLCENLTDCLFYKQIEKNYRNRMQPCRSMTNQCVMLNRNGGGATTLQVVKDEKERGEHLCLVITDSDKKYPEDNISNAIQEIRDECVNDGEHYIHHYYMQDCMEAENLIPIHLLDHPNRCLKAKEFIDRRCDLNYLDMKEGMRLSSLYDDYVYSYWTGMFDAHNMSFSISDRDVEKSSSPSRKAYNTRCSNRTDRGIIFDGWGNDVLDKTLKIEKGSGIRDVKNGQLLPYQLQNWNNIGKLLFEWGLASRPIL